MWGFTVTTRQPLTAASTNQPSFWSVSTTTVPPEIFPTTTKLSWINPKIRPQTAKPGEGANYRLIKIVLA